ncbi:polysaccharide biosynthesis C-terminal domain-containing protein [Bacillus cereus]
MVFIISGKITLFQIFQMNSLKNYMQHISLFYEKNDFAYKLEMKRDNRGFLAEIVKSNEFGQIFISSTKENVIRGNHYHHTKSRKILCDEGRS